MKKGRFFRIPQSPADLDRLRAEAAALDFSTRPTWLSEADSELYRYLGEQPCRLCDASDQHVLQQEIRELEEAGLVVVCADADHHVWRVYVPSAADYDLWSIGIYRGASPFHLRPWPEASGPVLTREHVTDTPACLVADPFIVRERQTWFMFFELLNWRANKGEIGLAVSTDCVQWEYKQRVLVEPFHLSYPYVFRSDGEYYMVPEARQSGAVRLYRAVQFPFRWSSVAVILEHPHLLDASLFRTDGHWWLLAGSDASGANDALHLYYADALTGPWKEHPCSPVVSGDAHSARPAGRVLLHEGRVFRFAQNCRPSYGLDVRAFEITSLSTDDYREIPVEAGPVLGPSGTGWNAGGMHHIDAHQLDDGSWIASVDGWTKQVWA